MPRMTLAAHAAASIIASEMGNPAVWLLQRKFCFSPVPDTLASGSAATLPALNPQMSTRTAAAYNQHFNADMFWIPC
jgi:hypothetical protein